MKTNALVCWKCGALLNDQPLPLGRLATCTRCRSYLHVCRLCISYDVNLTRRCREQDAEEVSDKERSNFCAYFKPLPNAFRPGGQARAAEARSQLVDLFGPSDDAEK